MYLKSLELSGFKSFAERTKLIFEPGITAIVGPNGCGKSNVSDAIRWVLGEQRPSALRGNKMLDIIFNGTDTRKPLGMAEVSITFADCEKTLGIDYNEVTVSRRVFRSGECEYFINKTSCRLKDIQRLFMNTGIGTTSYSVMAQGQIDAILSSRPEDRRTIFEEAAGISKFKADRKEALRKLEQTEANLLRLADVIRELHRQINSLQRQATKAQKYQHLKEEARGLDIFVTRRALAVLDSTLAALNERENILGASAQKSAEDVATLEAERAAKNAAMLENEERITKASAEATADSARLAHVKELVSINEERISEYRELAERDSKEVALLLEQIDAAAKEVEELKAKVESRKTELAQQRERTNAQRNVVTLKRAELDSMRRDLLAKREEDLKRQRTAARLQNELSGLQARASAAVMHRERIEKESAALQNEVEGLGAKVEARKAELESANSAIRDAEKSLAAAEKNLLSTRETLAAALEASAILARIELPADIPTGALVDTVTGARFRDADSNYNELCLTNIQTNVPYALIPSGNENSAARKEYESAARRAIDEARANLAEARKSAAKASGEAAAASAEWRRANERVKSLAMALSAAVKDVEIADTGKAAREKELEALFDGKENFATIIAQLQESLTAKEAQFAAINDELTELRVEESKRAQEMASASGELEIREARLRELSRNREARAKGVQEYLEYIEKLSKETEHNREQIGGLQTKAADSEKSLEELLALRAEKAKVLAEAEATLGKSRRELDDLRAKHGAVEIELTESRMRRANHLERILKDYGLDEQQFIAEPDKTDVDEETAEKRLATLKSEIAAIGPVNLVAIEEYKQLEERYALEKAQEADLVKSKDLLVELLKNINKKTSEMFQATFEQANANFEAMFTKLFNGGTAKLVMIENPEDPLECGVDVIARPPGKRPQSISLLSGGERTMTAVALLFAIYQIKPSPFCLLDELDAALDDSNIGRFISMLNNFLSQSQFIIITHNQHTIANSEIVYGVTMQEKGVSRVISMRLPDMGVRELDLPTEAPPEEPPTLRPKRRRTPKPPAKNDDSAEKSAAKTTSDAE